MPPKKMYRRRRPAAKKSAKRANAPLPKNVRQNTMFCKRMTTLSQLVLQRPTTWSAFPLTFRLDQLPAYTEFTSLFDSYKIHAIKLLFTPLWDSVDVANDTQAPFPTLPRVYTVVDRNGFPSGSLASESLFLESAKTRMIRKPQEPFSIYIRAPGVEGAVSIGGFFTANAKQNYKPWVDTSRPDVEHLGCAIGMASTGGADGAKWIYNVTATFYMEFKNVV